MESHTDASQNDEAAGWCCPKGGWSVLRLSDSKNLGCPVLALLGRAEQREHHIKPPTPFLLPHLISGSPASWLAGVK